MAKLYLVNGRIFYEDSDKLALVKGSILNSETSGAVNISETGVEGTVVVAGETSSTDTDQNITGVEGTVVVAGETATTDVDQNITGTEGAVVVAGETATLIADKIITGVEGSVVVTGETATTDVDQNITGTEGAVVVAGEVASLIADQNNTGVEGAVVVAGETATTDIDQNITGTEGAVVVAGETADVTVGNNSVVDGVEGAIVVAGETATTDVDQNITGTEGAVVVAGETAAADVDLTVAGVEGAVVVAGETATLIADQNNTGVEGAVVVAGETASTIQTDNVYAYVTEVIKDPGFDVPNHWVLSPYVPSYLYIDESVLWVGEWPTIKEAAPVNADQVVAGRTYLVYIDMLAYGGFLGFEVIPSIGGQTFDAPYEKISSDYTEAVNTTTENAWRHGLEITALSNGTIDNTKLEFSQFDDNGRVASFSIQELTPGIVVAGEVASADVDLIITGVEGSVVVAGETANIAIGLELTGVEGTVVVAGEVASTDVDLTVTGIEGSVVVAGETASTIQTDNVYAYVTEVIKDPGFDRPTDWIPNNAGIYLDSDHTGTFVFAWELPVTKEVAPVNADQVVAGRTYLVAIDMKSYIGSAGWEILPIIGGQTFDAPYEKLSGDYTEAVNTATENAWRHGLEITALETGTIANTVLRFSWLVETGMAYSFSIQEITPGVVVAGETATTDVDLSITGTEGSVIVAGETPSVDASVIVAGIVDNVDVVGQIANIEIGDDTVIVGIEGIVAVEGLVSSSITDQIITGTVGTIDISGLQAAANTTIGAEEGAVTVTGNIPSIFITCTGGTTTVCIGDATNVIRDDKKVLIVNTDVETLLVVKDTPVLIPQDTSTTIIPQNDEAQIISIPCTITYTGAATGDPCDEENEEMFSKRVNFIDETLLYRGEAQPGTAESSPAWRIRKITIAALDNDIVETWADGTDTFTKIWDNHLSYSYS